MSQLSAFFKGSDTTFGIFYPVHYIVAIFPDDRTAGDAERALRRSIHGKDFEEDDVISVPGSEVIRYSNEHLKDSTLGALLMQKLSAMFQTEEIYMKHDLMLAEHGAAFVAVYCPTEARKKEAWEILSSRKSLVARYYALGAIEHLKGEV